MSKLRQASELANGGDGFVRWVSAVASAGEQRTAAENLAVALAAVGGVSVRMGWGDARLRRLFDSRLGWLGPESGLFQDAAAVWEHSQTIDGYQHLTIQHPENGRQAVFWIHRKAPETLVREFAERRETLAELIWSRPSPWLSRLTSPVMGTMSRQRGRWLVVAMVAVSAALVLLPVHYPVHCNVVVETTHARYVTTPFEATLLRAEVRVGDEVHAGQTLFTLDGRPMRIERQGLLAERQESSKQYDSALASGRIADAQQARLKREQIDRKLELLSNRLGQLEVVSPIDGVVVSGDLEKRVGSPMDRGEAVVEIAAMHPLRLELEIPDHDIQMTGVSHALSARLNALGNRTFETTVDQIRPAAEIRDDRNVFIATVEVDNQDGNIRPGMRGEGVIDGPIRPWIWSHVRDVFEKTLWSLGY